MTATGLVPGITVGAARRLTAQALRDRGIDTPELDARILTGHALEFDHAALVSRSDRTLDDAQALALQECLARRLAGEPVARITGVKEFWGLPLHITAATLVPRPETETIVEAALTLIDEGGPRDRPLRFADLGTGSGALLLALLSELPNALGVATDIDEAALTTARGNARRHGLGARAGFAACDFGAALEGGFDLIVVNPPYIRSGEISQLPPEVRRDPRIALDGGADGLACYAAIASDARRLLTPEGRIVLELGAGQADAVAALLYANRLEAMRPLADLSGIARALPARVAAMPP